MLLYEEEKIGEKKWQHKTMGESFGNQENIVSYCKITIKMIFIENI